jgi:hypothetical protein
MPLQVVLEKDAVVGALHELLPLRIHLDPRVRGKPNPNGRYIQLDVPTLIELVEGQGVRVACSAEIRWVVAGLPVPLRLHRVQLVLRPKVRRDPAAGNSLCLAFELRIEHADLSGVPSFLDDQLVELINGELRQRPLLLAWRMGQSLSHRFVIPPVLEPIDALGLEVADASVSVGADAIRMAIDFYLTVERARVRSKASGRASGTPRHPSR